jgi:hypothetical protein
VFNPQYCPKQTTKNLKNFLSSKPLRQQIFSFVIGMGFCNTSGILPAFFLFGYIFAFWIVYDLQQISP